VTVLSDDGSRFGPTCTLDALRIRSKILAEIRRFFDERHFLEVETPLLSADVIVDRYIEPIPVQLPGRRMWLQTSPEFAMKRLLVAGARSIYQIGHAFRAGECGPLHNPEFTILEWYRAGDSYEQGMSLLSDFVHAVMKTGRPERITYRNAFLKFANVDPLLADVNELENSARALGISVPASLDQTDRNEWLNLLLATAVEGHLGRTVPTILYDYPHGQSGLARIRHSDPPVAERFELYAQGVELANGYHELLDADELLRRNKYNNDHRERDGRARLPESSRLCEAMRAGLPACTGVALGIDRLVMLATSSKDLTAVIPFPIDRA
jgi:lysyl-tRNA synthetase class 2